MPPKKKQSKKNKGKKISENSSVNTSPEIAKHDLPVEEVHDEIENQEHKISLSVKASDYEIEPSRPIVVEQPKQSLLTQAAVKIQSLPKDEGNIQIPKTKATLETEKILSKSLGNTRSKSPSNSLSRSIPKSIPRRPSTVKGATPSSLFQAAHLKNVAAGINSDSDIDEILGVQEVNNIVAEHLVQPPSDSGASFGSMSHSLVGGAITRDIYKWKENRESKEGQRQRRNSEPDVVIPVSPTMQTAGDLREPGGFRRHFIQNKARREGKKPPNFVTSNFIDFLVLYGFYGGDVYPSDDEDEGDELPSVPGDIEDEIVQESAPLLPRASSTTNTTVKGTSEAKAFFMMVKAFVGTGVLFLPKAFSNGGLLFSVITMLVLGYMTLHCMILLVDTSRALGHKSFGDIGEHIYGSKMRKLVLASIAVSQMGFCCAYFIFVGQNLRDLLMITSNCKLILPDWFFILLQLLLYIPLAWVRRIKNFGITSLIADVFILLGLGYIFVYDLILIGERGVQNVPWVNLQSFPLFIGTAMFAFEGICLMLPIAESMKQPERFNHVLTYGMMVIGGVFLTIGTLGYLALGDEVETIVFLNLPKSPVVSGIQFLYAIAIMLSFPLCVYPAIRITEQAIFGLSTGKASTLIKWEKNLYRAGLTMMLGLIAWAGSTNLDKVVSLVGCFACIPLSFIYPALFHLNVSKNKWVVAKDWIVVVFGTLAMVYTTYITLQQWAIGGPEIPRDRCHDSRGNLLTQPL
ncbi:neutral amino acid transporter [Boothiomyces sp. JEL0866]|nr:neutral amino acid transporter [Boothiomyces sp. JEL0866]